MRLDSGVSPWSTRRPGSLGVANSACGPVTGWATIQSTKSGSKKRYPRPTLIDRISPASAMACSSMRGDSNEPCSLRKPHPVDASTIAKRIQVAIKIRTAHS